MVEEEITTRDTKAWSNVSIFGSYGVAVKQTILKIECPKSLPLKYEVRQMPDLKPESSEREGIVHLKFSRDSMEPLEFGRGLDPPEIATRPCVAFATGDSWNSVASACAEIVDRQIQAADLKQPLGKIELVSFLDDIKDRRVKKAINEYERDPSWFFTHYPRFRQRPREYWIEHTLHGRSHYATRPILAAAYHYAKPNNKVKTPRDFAPSKIGEADLKRSLKRLRFRVIPIRGHRKTRKGRSPRQPDQLKKVEVENAATAEVKRFYAAPKWNTKDVSKENKGWDLEASSFWNSKSIAKKSLLLEVKGLSGNRLSVELTHNEYETMKAKASDYRVCIVVNALHDATRRLYVFRFMPKTNAMLDENGQRLAIRKVIAARLY